MTIQSLKPSSVYELAKLLGKDQLNINKTIAFFEGYGIIKVKESKKNNWEVFIPKLEYTTDNAAMIGIVGHLKYKESIESSLNATPSPRLTF